MVIFAYKTQLVEYCEVN